MFLTPPTALDSLDSIKPRTPVHLRSSYAITNMHGELSTTHHIFCFVIILVLLWYSVVESNDVVIGKNTCAGYFTS